MRKWQLMVSAAIVVVAIAPWIVLWSSLPDEVATHWNTGGDANGHMSRVAALLVLGGVSVALAAGAALQRKHVASPILAFVGSIISFASLATALANRDEASWQTAHDGLLWVVVGMLAGAGAAWVYARDTALPNTSPSGERLVLSVTDSERVAWIGSSTSRWLRVGGLVGLAFGVVALIALPEPAGVIVTAAALAVVHVASVHVTVSRDGVRVRGAFGWPGVMLPIARIESADSIEVNPWQWGGWGYRGSLTVMRRAAWNTRGGPGLRLVLQHNKQFVVTVDGANEAAAVVNGLLTSTPR